MSRKVLIAPSILSADFARLGEELRAIERGGADWVHIDIMDGHFVPNVTIGPVAVKGMRPHSKLVFDVHLMMSNPRKYLRAFADAGADYITVHAECDDCVAESLAEIRRLGKKAGVSINPGTPLDTVEDALRTADLLLVMTVKPGFAGQKFMDSEVHKIAEARKMIDAERLPVTIVVDGGITTENAGIAAGAGADVLVAGSAVFCGKGTVAENIEAIRESAMRHVH
ncbi:MAG: ribulose-phosphate 3-epimerase [Methanobacteriota archaeon]